MGRLFTLKEAEGLLPEVDRLLRGLIENKRAHDVLEKELGVIARRISLLGGIIPPRQQAADLKQRKDSLTRGFRSKAERILEMGVELKDLEMGLVDFPTLYRGQEVYMCWKLGESGISHWHHVADGFRGRRPIDGEFLQNHTAGEQRNC